MTSPRKRTLVSGWMTAHLITVAQDEELFAAVEKMAERAIRHVLVMDGETLVGILSNRDLVRATFRDPERKLDLHGVPVSQVMTPNPITIAPDASICEAAKVMVEHAINALPVITDGAPTGVLTSDDLLRALSVQDLAAPLPQL
jgi:CBS domain-containing protein